MKKLTGFYLNALLLTALVLFGNINLLAQRSVSGTIKDSPASTMGDELRPFDFSDKYYETHGLTTNRRKELKARRQLVAKYARRLITSDPLFLIKETVDALLRKSLMPIVNQHMTEI